MRKLSIIMLMLLVTTFALMGCKKNPPINNPLVGINTSKALTQDEVRLAIITACPRTHWVAKDIKPGEIEATVHVRSHTAVVTISYNAKEYHIKYKSSTNLHAKDGTIHKNYNGWIDNLRRNIDVELAHIANRK